MKPICTLLGIGIGAFVANIMWLPLSDTADRAGLTVCAAIFTIIAVFANAYDWEA